MRENEIYLINKGLTELFSRGEFICWIMTVLRGASTRRKSSWFLNPFNECKLMENSAFFSLLRKEIRKRERRKLQCAFVSIRFEWANFHQRLPFVNVCGKYGKFHDWSDSSATCHSTLCWIKYAEFICWGTFINKIFFVIN